MVVTIGYVGSVSSGAISVRGLRKSYGEHEAVARIDFEVARNPRPGPAEAHKSVNSLCQSSNTRLGAGFRY
jgi:hypothetical protein